MNPKPTLTPQSHQGGGGHETTDARAGWIFAIVFAMGIGAVVIHFVVNGVLHAFEKQPAPRDRWPAVTQARQNATAWTNRFPPLQVNPPIDLRTFRAREEAQLSAYGWMDRSAGVVRIPVTRAMDVLLEKGWPIRQGTNDTTGPSSWELQQQRAARGLKAE
jgi:hypothetical protein